MLLSSTLGALIAINLILNCESACDAGTCICDPTFLGFRVQYCPEGWTRFQTDKCFKLFPNSKSHSDSEKDCKELGSTLASVGSSEENAFLLSYAKQNKDKPKKATDHIWLGGAERDSGYFWSDFSPFTYPIWITASSNKDKCAHLSTEDKTKSSKTLETSFCSEELAYICQKLQTDSKRIYIIRSGDKGGRGESETMYSGEETWKFWKEGGGDSADGKHGKGSSLSTTEKKWKFGEYGKEGGEPDKKVHLDSKGTNSGGTNAADTKGEKNVADTTKGKSKHGPPDSSWKIETIETKTTYIEDDDADNNGAKSGSKHSSAGDDVKDDSGSTWKVEKVETKSTETSGKGDGKDRDSNKGNGQPGGDGDAKIDKGGADTKEGNKFESSSTMSEKFGTGKESGDGGYTDDGDLTDEKNDKPQKRGGRWSKTEKRWKFSNKEVDADGKSDEGSTNTKGDDDGDLNDEKNDKPKKRGGWWSKTEKRWKFSKKDDGADVKSDAGSTSTKEEDGDLNDEKNDKPKRRGGWWSKTEKTWKFSKKDSDADGSGKADKDSTSTNGDDGNLNDEKNDKPKKRGGWWSRTEKKWKFSKREKGDDDADESIKTSGGSESHATSTNADDGDLNDEKNDKPKKRGGWWSRTEKKWKFSKREKGDDDADESRKTSERSESHSTSTNADDGDLNDEKNDKPKKRGGWWSRTEKRWKFSKREKGDDDADESRKTSVRSESHSTSTNADDGDLNDEKNDKPKKRGGWWSRTEKRWKFSKREKGDDEDESRKTSGGSESHSTSTNADDGDLNDEKNDKPKKRGGWWSRTEKRWKFSKREKGDEDSGESSHFGGKHKGSSSSSSSTTEKKWIFGKKGKGGGDSSGEESSKSFSSGSRHKGRGDKDEDDKVRKTGSSKKHKASHDDNDDTGDSKSKSKKKSSKGSKKSSDDESSEDGGGLSFTVSFGRGFSSPGSNGTNSSSPGKKKSKSAGFTAVYREGDPGKGIGGYDIKFPADRSFAFDYEHSGKLDHIVFYRPGTGAFWILKNTNGTFTPVYNKFGIAEYDLKSPNDIAFAFDYESSGKLDYLVLYRPGTGAIGIIKNSNGVFTNVYGSVALKTFGIGIGSFDLKSPADRAFAFDFDHSGKLDHLVLYRPGTGVVFVVKNEKGVFRPVYGQAASEFGKGIGGFDLKRANDQMFAFDFNGSGKMDHIVIFRPGTGSIFILKNEKGKFSPVYSQPDPGIGIGGYDLKSKNDHAFAFDYEGSGRQSHLALYRPGTGMFWILQNSNGNFTPAYMSTSDPSQQARIGGFDLLREYDLAYGYDYEHSGRNDYIVIYRPATGTVWILRNDDRGQWDTEVEVTEYIYSSTEAPKM